MNIFRSSRRKRASRAKMSHAKSIERKKHLPTMASRVPWNAPQALLPNKFGIFGSATLGLEKRYTISTKYCS